MCEPAHQAEETVNIFAPMPHRYIFVPNRNDTITAACRARTHAIGRTVYVVQDSRGEAMGLRVPHYVLEPILFEEAVKEEGGAQEQETAASRRRDETPRDPLWDLDLDSDTALALELALNPERDSEWEGEREEGCDSGEMVTPETQFPVEGEFDWIVEDEYSESSHAECEYESSADSGSVESDWTVDDDEEDDEDDL